jgi:hypothetical protein
MGGKKKATTIQNQNVAAGFTPKDDHQGLQLATTAAL